MGDAMNLFVLNFAIFNFKYLILETTFVNLIEANNFAF